MPEEEKRSIFDRIKDVFDGDDDDKKAEEKPQGLFGSITERAKEKMDEAQAAAQKADDQPKSWADNLRDRAKEVIEEREATKGGASATLGNRTSQAPDNAAQAAKPNAGASTSASDSFAESLKRASEAAKQAAEQKATEMASPAAPAAPTAPAEQRHTVQSGDTLGKIAQRYYGDASQWRKIWDANRDQISNPDVIDVGQNFVIPDASAHSQGSRRYTVRSGDTLRAIAERFYGDEMQWRKIWDANRDQISNPDVIDVGQEFDIP